MATNKKITELTELSEVDLAADDVLAIVDVSAGTTHKVRKSTLASALSGVSSITATTPIAVDQSTGAVVVSTGTIPITKGGTGATSAIAALAALGGFSDPTDTRGDIITRGASAIGKLGVGTSVQVLRSDGTDPLWGAVAASELTGTLPLANGGTGLSSIGVAGQALTVNSAASALEWVAPIIVECGTATGSADAIALTPGNAVTSLTKGLVLRWTSSASTNTGAATLAVSGLTATAMEIDNAALAAGAHIASKNFLGYYDGTAFQIEQISAATVVQASPDREIFTATGTFTKSGLPAYATHITVHVWGAGGGGGAGNTSTPSRGYPAGGGGYSMERLAVSALGATETVTIGAGGAGGGSSGISGSGGGTSSFGAFCSASGGAGGGAGQAGASALAGSAGGYGTGGDLNLYGQSGAIVTLQVSAAFMPGTAPGLGGVTGGLNVGSAGDKGSGGGGGNHAGSPAAGSGGAGLIIVEW